MRARRHLALILAALALAPAVATGLPILSSEDGAELAQALAEAQEEQGVCYGWTVAVTGSAEGEVGSSTGGPGVPIDRSKCTKWVELVADIVYTPESSESDDSATVRVDANLPINFSLSRIGLRAKDLVGSRDDAALVAMVESLPLIVAEDSDAPFIAFEPQSQPITGVAPTDRPGSDWWRHYWPFVVLVTLLPAAIVGIWLATRPATQKRVRTWLSDDTREDE